MGITSLMQVGVLEKPVSNPNGMQDGIGKASEWIVDWATSSLL